MGPKPGGPPQRRPKRAAESFARTQLQSEAGPSSKKQRFDARNPSTLPADAPEEDPILDLDEIGKGPQTKRNAVELDGYESDSSNENFNTRAQAKADALQKGKQEQASKDVEANDMFADLDDNVADGDEDEDVVKESKQKKKEVRFMNADQIEGQISSSKAGGHVHADFMRNGNGMRRTGESETSSDESGDDEERDTVPEDIDEELGAGSKKKNAPKLDAFNMKSEAEEGRFDESGNFVRKAADPHAVHDSWLEGSTKADMRRAREAHEKREEERRRRDAADDSISTGDILSSLISRMEAEETVLEALARMGTSKSKRKPKQHQKKARESNQEMDVDEEVTAEDRGEINRRETIEAISAAADQLLTRGQTDIYETERGMLMRQFRRETGTEWADSPHPGKNGGNTDETKQWEYRWSDARDGGESHGPFDGKSMSAWSDAGYFGEGVEFRRIGSIDWNSSIDTF